jgi:Fe-S-cluster containining protein
MTKSGKYKQSHFPSQKRYQCMKCNRCCQVPTHSTYLAYEPSKEPTGNLRALGEQSSARGGALGERFSESLCSSGGSRKGWNIDARTNNYGNL